MDFFNLEGIKDYKNANNLKYDHTSSYADTYKSTRNKLNYFVNEYINPRLNTNLQEVYSEKPNVQLGRGKGFGYKHYILKGFNYTNELGKQIFIKLSFGNLFGAASFNIDLDLDYSKKESFFSTRRDEINDKSFVSYKVQKDFPDSYEALFNLINKDFEKCLKYMQKLNNEFLLKKEIELLRYKKQIILQGPPGTGKTRMAKKIAQSILNVSEEELDKTTQFKLIQFHPSYTYEDFVRGIVVKPNESGEGILYKAENKILGEFAKRALVNFENYYKDQETFNKEEKLKQNFDDFLEVIQNDLEEGPIPLTETMGLVALEEDGFRVKGLTEERSSIKLKNKDVLQAYQDGNKVRQDVRYNTNLSGTAMRFASYTIRIVNKFQGFIAKNGLSNKEVQKQKPELKSYILVIDEINRANLSSVLGELIYALEYRGEKVESMYAVEDSNELVLPPNLYIIGTMNTADRSVGHIDYAIRRRFAFVDVLPKDLSADPKITFHKELFDKVTELFTEDKEYTYKNPSKHLSLEFKAKDVALGHSYFIEDKEEGGNMEIRLDYEIKPILREYVNDGVLVGEDVLDRIENLSV